MVEYIFLDVIIQRETNLCYKLTCYKTHMCRYAMLPSNLVRRTFKDVYFVEILRSNVK